MNAALLRARLAAAAEAPPHADVSWRWDEADDIERPLIRAAVLVPIVLEAEPSILLTKRTASLRSHAGQVSFPGGRIDPADHDAEAAALREAEEEIGLNPAAVELAGRLADHVTGSGYRITPILALLLPGTPLRPAPAEVESVFLLPVSVLLDPAAPRRERIIDRDRWHEFWVWPHDTHYIWGATAAILLRLAARLR